MDLTYLYEAEPIEPEDLVVIDRLPHPLLDRTIKNALLDLGYYWFGASACSLYNPEPHVMVINGRTLPAIVAQMQLGTQASAFVQVPNDLEIVNKFSRVLKWYRFRHPATGLNYPISLDTITASTHNNNVWFNFQAKYEIKDQT